MQPLVAFPRTGLDELIIRWVVATLPSQDDNFDGRGLIVQVLQQPRVVCPTDCASYKKDLAVGKGESVLGFGGRVSVVQYDEDGADLGDCKEDCGILLAVASHYSNTVANANAHIEQRLGQRRTLLVEFVIRPSCSCPGNNKALFGAILIGLELEELAESQIDEGWIRWAMEERKLPGGWRRIWLDGC